MTQTHFVELRNITKWFGTNTVIDTINLAIPKGEMASLVTGLEKTTCGQIFIDG